MTSVTKLITVAYLAAMPAIAAPPAAENALFRRFGHVKPDSGFRQDGWWVWGSSIVKGDDGKFHMFVSRWPKTMLMHPGWLVASEIIHCVADEVEGPYKFSDIALGDRGSEFWDGKSAHNPKIFRRGDEYVLFYMGSTHPFEDARKNPEKITLDSPYTLVARANKRIGVATSKSPYGPWKRLDRPVLDVKPDSYYSYLVSNPAPHIAADGKVTLVFKSRRHTDKFPFYTGFSLGIATADSPAGPYAVSGNPIFGEGTAIPEAEDPYLWKDGSGFHLIFKDQLGRITGSRGFGVIANSTDGKSWELDAAPLAYTKTVTMTDGTPMTFGQMERAQGVTDARGNLTHFTFAVMDGNGGFSGGRNTWNIVVPLKPEKSE